MKIATRTGAYALRAILLAVVLVPMSSSAAMSPDAKQSTALRLTAPKNGSIVKGQVKIVAKGNPEAASIGFFVDGAKVATAPPLSATWNSSSVAPGVHTIQVI